MNDVNSVSVIICTYNRSVSLGITLNSLVSMILPENVDLEIIVVDNNSGDGTPEMVSRFIEHGFCTVRYVFEALQGLSHARNAGFAAAQGDIIVFTDDDVVVDQYWLASIIETFRQFDADCVGGKIMPIWPSERPLWLTKEIEGNIAILDYGDAAMVMDGEKILLYGANVSFSRRILEKVGCFDTSLGRKGDKLYSHEDKELYTRVIHAGGKVIYQPNAVVHHMIGTHRTRKSYFRKWHFDDGEFNGLCLGVYRQRSLLGIPLYALREFLSFCLKFIVNYLTSRTVNNFLHELAICNSLGFMSGRLKFFFSRIPRDTAFAGQVKTGVQT